MRNSLVQTPSQTVGPFFAYGLTARQYGYKGGQIADAVIADETCPGERIVITGRVLDGAGAPIEDALVEIWQCDAAGRVAGPATPGFRGFGRCGTGIDPERRFRFETVRPGVAAGEGGAPHLSVILFMRGLLSHAFTRIYFPEDIAALAADPVLALVPEARRETLVARRLVVPGLPAYGFDIRMQGDGETVFFDV
ncbi:protocatechuate 3,4-dioxygenase subunit alpha [Tistrella mobilis]|uniref:protocatechuate 3,4-dioxygenase subunit alpha n=1 Tax=Tistrella mobilis TaxID=171437 RepID=UPI0031F66DC9